MSAQPGHLVLADGTSFEGRLIGASGDTVGEVVFMTGMTGYQEVLTDPSYCDQIVSMTAPHIGNTGINAEDQESERPSLAGFVVHALSPTTSNWRSEGALDTYLKRHGVVGIANVDTRALTRHVRTEGAQMGAIGSKSRAELHDMAQAAPSLLGRDLAAKVSTPESFVWTHGTGQWSSEAERAAPTYHVVALDFGIKHNILRCLVDEGCKVTVLPANASSEQVLSHNPDGVLLSNGPGDPEPIAYASRTVSALLGKLPIFGICLGHQILARALGASTYKLKFGHHGLNQPVQDLGTHRVEITSQNHGFCVDDTSLPKGCQPTHIQLNDMTNEGIEHPESGAFSVQYHPEAGAGPHDARYLFKRFIERIEQWR
ncbi:MAG: glutamine-hydrolyzing carbamoyl-phosphate synthase small subunit [Myxococcales bacterium]|nr:glutamine-hydrolyzing carbamoyl-phosphate synthase small subunit [Myxococcales bacterium]